MYICAYSGHFSFHLLFCVVFLTDVVDQIYTAITILIKKWFRTFISLWLPDAQSSLIIFCDSSLPLEKEEYRWYWNKSIPLSDNIFWSKRSNNGSFWFHIFKYSLSPLLILMVHVTKMFDLSFLEKTSYF